MKDKKRILKIILPAAAASAVVLAGILFTLSYFGLLPERTYTAEELGLPTVKSIIDFNNNGIDDYTDFVSGARRDAANRPKYDGSYWPEGYPPDNIGVCTDVIWRAFREAGYSLRAMLDADIERRPEAYTRIETPDSNIDFRRVYNLRVFFDKYAVRLTDDIGNVSEWQPGDIVIFRNDKHIGIISEKRTREGVPYVIHNGGQPRYEENYLPRSEVTGHYRFDAALVDSKVLASFL